MKKATVIMVILCFLLTLLSDKLGTERDRIIGEQSTHPEVATPEVILRLLKPETQGMRTWNNLSLSLQKTIRYAERKDQSSYAFSSDIKWEEILSSLRHLKSILPFLDNNLSVLTEQFDWIPLHKDKPFLFTGYYHPLLEASREERSDYTPIYRMPSDRKKGIPYFTRKEIMNGALKDRNLEIAWVRDKFESFILEVQGSGCLEFENGDIRCIRYAGQNGHKYRSSRRILNENNLLRNADITAQREYFRKNPDKLYVLNENPSFVFFEETEETEAIGAMNTTLREWVSVAVDKNVIPLGSIVVVGTMIPDPERGEIPFFAITIAQDTGGAIKKNRIDIFCGSDKRASYISSRMDSRGCAWILLSKDRMKNQ